MALRGFRSGSRRVGQAMAALATGMMLAGCSSPAPGSKPRWADPGLFSGKVEAIASTMAPDIARPRDSTNGDAALARATPDGLRDPSRNATRTQEHLSASGRQLAALLPRGGPMRSDPAAVMTVFVIAKLPRTLQ